MGFFKKHQSFWILLTICLVAFALFFWISWLISGESGLPPNEFGDSAGSVNAIFSAMALAGVIYAVILQKDELEETRSELQLQRQEFEKQNKILDIQRFEHSFYNMLSLFQSIVEGLEFQYDDEEVVQIFGNEYTTEKRKFRNSVKGRDVFRFAYMEMEHKRIKDDVATPVRAYHGIGRAMAAQGYDCYNEYATPSYFDHYFRTAYRILKFLKTTPLLKTDAERYEYASTLRSQFSRYELVWLYYNCLVGIGKEKFKPLIEEFAMFKNLRPELLIKGHREPNDFSDSAFGHTTIQPNTGA